MTKDPDDTDEMPAWRESETRAPAGESAWVEVDLAALSHPGLVRTNNEDHYYVARVNRSLETLDTNLPEGEVPRHYAETAYGLLVADGVGGAAAGEVASRTAVHALIDLVIATPDWIMRLDQSLADEVLQRMERRFQQVRDVLIKRAKDDPSLRGMGTTMTVACTLGTEVLSAHVGDSRAYVLRRGGALERLTRDQTLAQSLVDAGAIKPEEIASHPGRNILTSALATRLAFAQVELKRARIGDGDQLLLCSDGLTDMVPDDVIARELRAPGGSAEVCRRLVDLALEAGGKDNVTVVLGRYRIPQAPPVAGSHPH
jgi:serine/threonine protein phosphatase PrpC